ncbi:MAG: dUTP diphosphatase [Proteobacteria bacterium]|nr:dUTP diphosphatase [Desulfobulbaceae bacterium]MBU4151902.1 dUTP diphosphatase [Pseudomonadota bacterium]MDP2106006.1 dUTP diphosphatase [Desulfobulbaceae bacterium]
MSETGDTVSQKRHRLELCWVTETLDLQLPAYHSELAAGMDVMAAVVAPVVIPPGGVVLIATGFAVALAAGYELQVRPRSGLAVKHGVTVINAPGTIDADYRGEVKVALINLGLSPYTVNRGDRIAQLVLAPVCRAEIAVVSELPPTRRQDGGFGHTGV